jgi:DNA primase
MKTYTKESLELLRSRIDLIEVLSPYVSFSKSGSYFKACCPFHEEKTPSFVIQRGDMHYHCYGCSAHGDAISFLMNYQKMSFSDAVEFLAEKFGVHLECEENDSFTGPSKKSLKEVLDMACRFYHFLLLHSEEGQDALKYLYDRAIDLNFIKAFQIGLSLKNSSLLQSYMKEKKVDFHLLYQTGLIKNSKDFFAERIMFPIRDNMGSVIGFSARKYKEETFGPKYVNTPETVLFKKSKILFGLNYSRKNIAKQRKVIIVEGQIDALRLIYLGFCISVASQGTALTQEHVKELITLGINQAYIAFDSDTAGQEAAVKIGNLFQKNAIETYVLKLPPNMDPDDILINYGPKYFEKLITQSSDYLTFLIEMFSKKINIKSPAGKNELVQKIVERIKDWDHPLMVHESLRKLAKLTQIPENMISMGKDLSYDIYKQPNIFSSNINPNLILEADFLRILFLHSQSDPQLIEIAKSNLKDNYFKVEVCKNIFNKYKIFYQNSSIKDLLSFAIELNAEEKSFLNEILQKKINTDKIKENFINTIQKILDRFWMEAREEIKLKIQNASISDQEALSLAKQFDEIKNNRPQVIIY